MTARAIAFALAAWVAWAAPASADPELPTGSAFGLALLAPGERPELLLAQRVIERDWGPASDSLDLGRRAAGWRSEPFAFALSAALPGAGHVYAGEDGGLWFALAEVAGWTARWFFHRDLERGRERAAAIAGNPADSTSGWSFQRWERGGSGRDAADLEALWLADPAAFYGLIASDPSYLDGWSGANPEAVRAAFQRQRDLAEAAASRRRYSEIGLAINHVAAAMEALRAVRLHNLPIRRNLELELRGDWQRRGPAFLAVLERRF